MGGRLALRRLLVGLLFLLAGAGVTRANQAARGWCESGAQVVITSGLTSTTQVQASYPSCTVTVFVHGGGLATIYSDNNAFPTPLANPFTAQVNGQWIFYSTNGRYDVQLSGAGFPSPVTYSDISFNDSGNGGIVFGVFSSVPFSPTPIFNAATASIFSITLTGNVTSSTVNSPVQNGQVIEIYICQDASGGHSFTFPVNFTNTSFFTLATGGNACTPTTWWFNGTTWQPFSGGGNGAAGVIPPSLGGTGTGTPAAFGVAVSQGSVTPFAFITPTNNGQCFMSPPSNFATTLPSYQSCPTGTGGTSVGPLGTFQEAGASAGTFAAAPILDIGGLGTTLAYSADLEWNGGPNPWVDIRKFARQMPNNTTPVASGITATTSSGSPNITLSGLPTTPFLNGDGVSIYHAGTLTATNVPNAPSVTASGMALGMGTRMDKPSLSPTAGSTSYTYYSVGVTNNRGTSLPSAATTITNGAASLGVQTVNISSIAVSGKVATLTTSSPHTMSVGYEFGILSTQDANGNSLSAVFDGEYTVLSVPDTTHITYTMRQSTLNGLPTSAFNGTITWVNDNHIALTTVAGYEYYIIYGGLTSGTPAPVCITEPVNASLIGDQTYLACDDYGLTISGNNLPEWASATLPVAATNDNFVTTIVSGAGTTSMTLNASAVATGTNTIHFDNTPNYFAAATYANSIGASLYFSITSGNNTWFNASPITWPGGTKIKQAGQVIIGDMWRGAGTLSKWEGVLGAPCVRPQFSLVCAPQVLIRAAYPGFYTTNTQLDLLTFSAGTTNDPIPLVLMDGLNDGQLNNLNFAGSVSNSETLMMGLELRGHHNNGAEPFVNVLTNLSFTAGPNQVNYSSFTPLFYCNTCGQTTFGPHSIGRRGWLFRAPDSSTLATLHGGYNQGLIQPWIRAGAAEGGGVSLNLDNFQIDTSPMPLVSGLLGGPVTVIATNTNGPSSGAPLVTGNVSLQVLTSAGTTNGGYGANTNSCSGSSQIFDPLFSPALFANLTEGLCDISTHTNITPGYSIFASDINVIAPTCSVANAGPPFTPAATYTFTDAAVYFNGAFGSVSPKSASCTSNGSQQITVTMPSVPPVNSKGWQVFYNGFMAGNNFTIPSTTTASYLFTIPNGGGAPTHASSGPAGMQYNPTTKLGQVWGDFFPNPPNNTQNALMSIDNTGKLVDTPCVPSTAGSQCVFNGTSWILFAGNTTSQAIYEESAAGTPAWVAAPLGSLVGTGQSNTFTTGVQDFSAVTEFRPKSGLTSALPATCTGPTPMDVYIATDSEPGRNWYFCTATNIWTQQLNSGFLGLNTYGGPHTLSLAETWANFTATTTATVLHSINNRRWVVFCVSPCSTLTLAPDSGTITLNNATGATATITTGLGVEVACDGTNCFAWGLGGSGGGGSGTVASCSVNGPAYYTAATTVNCVPPFTTPAGVPYTLTSTPSGGVSQPPALALPGIVGRAVSGTVATDTIVSTDCNPNRVEYVGSVAVAVTLPTAVTLGVPKCLFKLVNATVPPQTVSITSTTWTLNGSVSPLALTFGQQLWVYVDPNSTTNWVADQTDLFGNVSGGAVPASAKLIGTNASSQLIAAALSNTHIYVGNGSNFPADVAAGGDVSLANTGVFTVLGANGGTFPASAAVLGTNSSKQPIAATGHGVVLPLQCADTSGSGSVQVCNTTPSFTPAAGDMIIYTTTTANTGASLTLNVNSLGAKPVAKWQNVTTLAANDIRANVYPVATYDGTNWELSTIGNAPSGGGGGTPCTTTANSVQYNNGGAFGCMTEFTYASSTLTLSSTGKIDLSATSVTAALRLPTAAGAAPTNAGILSYNSAVNRLELGNATNTSHIPWFTTSPTTNVLRKGSGTNGLQVDSTITDDGTLISTTEGVSIAPTSTSQVGLIVNNPTSTSVDIADFEVNGTKQAIISNSGEAFFGPSAPNPTVGTAGGIVCAEGTAPTGLANDDSLYCDSTQHAVTVNNNNTGNMPVSRIACSNVTPVTVSTNTTSDQNLMTCTLSANLLNVVGRVIKVSVAGVYSTAAASTASITMKAKLCTVSGCGSGTVITPLSATTGATTALSATNLMAQLFGNLITQTSGASSAYEAQGSMYIDLSATAAVASSVYPAINTATVGTIDSTGQLFLQITGAFSAGSTSNSMTERQLLVEVLN